ncbi:MAG: N-acetyl-gamma-glutamyl-phosphate reductase [Candidatus Binatia bacterium]
MGESRKRVQIVGATGYGGLGMTELLLRHPGIAIAGLLAKQDAGRRVSDVYPHLRGFCDVVIGDASDETVGRDADLVVFATPDGVGQAHARRLVAAGVPMLDYSGDFRFGTVADYDEYARRHPALGGRAHACPELLAQGVYGVPELNRDRLSGARLVGNPGCFAVAMILGLAPAAKLGLVERDGIIVDGKSGSSGAGKKPSAAHHFPERNENVTPYRIGSHQHAVEVEMTIAALAGGPLDLTFVPHLVPATRGIVCTIYAQLRQPAAPADVQAAYERFFASEPFVRVLPAGVSPGTGAVLGSNLCDLSVTVTAGGRRLVVTASIDNLVKGQAGVALQNVNLMLGFPETTGLDRVPIYP